jgi:CRISPR-associated endonuclease/helicase Cas3
MFAVLHAQHHRLERIVVALPFLSILDQTADIFRRVFESRLGSPAFVEHHSNIRPEHDTMANRLATENWDAPLIVTTQVQLFESLFGARPRDCRKLHNLTNSVIVLDEVQTLPVGLLAPILDQLQELTSHYGVSLLLTTATQPALHTRQLGGSFFTGFDPMPREVVPNAEMGQLFEVLRRVRVHWPTSESPVDWDELAGRLVGHDQVLAVVHRREDAATLWQLVQARAPGSALHLSALMCATHRREVLRRIERLLGPGEECRVIATQLVEAGVDLDFPVVYRALGGLESLAQAAGRCNREGRRPEGDFVVFVAPTEPPLSLVHHRDIARVMLAADPSLDLMHPTTFRSYFDRLYGHRSTDAHHIQRLRKNLSFASVAQTFRMIDDAGTTVFVPYGESGRRTIEELRARGPSTERFRSLQSLGVSVYPNALREMLRTGRVEVVHDSVHVLVAETDYDPDLGLRVEPAPFAPIIV